MQQNVLNSRHVLEHIQTLPLHLDDLIVALSIVERIWLWEIFQHIWWIEERNPGRVEPANFQQILRCFGLDGGRTRHCEWKWWISITLRAKWQFGQIQVVKFTLESTGIQLNSLKSKRKQENLNSENSREIRTFFENKQTRLRNKKENTRNLNLESVVSRSSHSLSVSNSSSLIYIVAFEAEAFAASRWWVELFSP